MAAGFVTKTVGDGNGGTFTARFWSSDGTTAGLLYPAPVLTDSTGAPIDFTAQSPVNAVPKATVNGSTSSRVNSAASTNATSLKAAAGNVVNIDVFNVAAYDVFLKLYNKAAAPTVGTDTPAWTIPIKAGTGFSREFVQGKSFATGLAYAITKLQADSDATAVAAGDLTGAIDWI